MCELVEIFEKARSGDEYEVCYIVNKFRPLILKYSRRLSIDCVETDLIISILEFINKVNLDEFRGRSEGIFVEYIVKMLTHKKIDIYRKAKTSRLEELLTDTNEMSWLQDSGDVESLVCWKEVFDSLPIREKEVIVKRYLMGYSIAEISNQMNISRQSVNKIKNNALYMLREQVG